MATMAHSKRTHRTLIRGVAYANSAEGTHGQNGPITAGMSLGLNCEELFWQHPIESSLDTAALSQRAALPGNYCRPGGLEFRELEGLRT